MKIIAIDTIYPGENDCNFYQFPASDLLVSGIIKVSDIKTKFL